MAAPTIEAARLMGRDGGPALESERLAFEAWMEGHCWPLAAEWVDGGYLGSSEVGGNVCPMASRTRQLWAAWRDRAALVDNGETLPRSHVDLILQGLQAAVRALEQEGPLVSDDRQKLAGRIAVIDRLAGKLSASRVTLHSSGREPE